MTRWFTLTSSTTYDWRSKVSNRFYQFVGIKSVAVTDPSDQLRFSTNPRRFVEVDEKGNILDKDAGGTMTRRAFSRQGMELQPQSYTKVGKKPAPDVVVIPTPEPPKPSAPRTVTSSNKTEAPAKDEAKDEAKIVSESEKAPDVDAVSESAPAKDSAPKAAKKASKKAKKASKKSKKSGSKGNN